MSDSENFIFNVTYYQSGIKTKKIIALNSSFSFKLPTNIKKVLNITANIVQLKHNQS